jgi:ABC-type Mn2+/Zn2+ transport system permease subunit
VVILVNRIYPGMMLMSISVDLASVEGIAATRYNLIYLAAIALIVSIGVKVTGSLLVGALVIIPPGTYNSPWKGPPVTQRETRSRSIA